MTFTELQREIEPLTPDFQKKLMGFLVRMELRRNGGDKMRSRLADKSEGAWIPLDKAKRIY